MNHEQEFQAYQTFQSKDEFNDFVLLLNDHKIDFETEDYPINFISDIRNDRFSHEYIVKLKSEDFSVADKIQEELALDQLEDIPSDYYLFEFTDDELIDILEAKDEWSKLDYVLAQEILKQRGITVSDKELSIIQMERIEKLSEPEKHSPVWIGIGYTSATLGGLIGIMIGWHLYNAKKVLPNGERIAVYAQTDRNHGFRIFVVGIIVLLIAVSIRVISNIP
ncbi:hypothetical protein D3C71_890520 [compost metagenome]